MPNLQLDIVGIIILLGIIQGIVLGIGLLTKSQNNKNANRVLGFLMISFSISIMHTVLYKMGIYNYYPHLIGIGYPIIFLFGPLFYIYLTVLLKKSSGRLIDIWPHFVPFILCFIYLLPFYFSEGSVKLMQIEREMTTTVEYDDIIIMVSQIIQMFIYITISSRLLLEHDKELRKTHSNIKQLNLQWLRKWIWGLTIIFGTMGVLLVIVVFGFKVKEVITIAPNLMAIMAAIGIYSIGYAGWRQPEQIQSILRDSTKYSKTGMTQNIIDQYAKKLQELLEVEKPYLNSDLTLGMLAENLSIPAHQLSQVINRSYNNNFYDLINKYRIEEAKQQLIDQEKLHYSILAIALDAGFNSKSVFNAAFKKYTGTTPSEFRINNRKQ